jgi:hypothetical protein
MQVKINIVLAKEIGNTNRKGHSGSSIDLKLWFLGKMGRWIFLANPGTSYCNINVNN